MRTTMLKGLSAILLAGVSAGFIVGFVSEPERAAAAASPAAKLTNAQNNAAINKALLIAAAATCTQTWPYYERSCLRDNRLLRSVRCADRSSPGAGRRGRAAD